MIFRLSLPELFTNVWVWTAFFCDKYMTPNLLIVRLHSYIPCIIILLALHLLIFFTATWHDGPDAGSGTISSWSTSCSRRDKSKIYQLFSGTCKIFGICSRASKCHHSYTQMSLGLILPAWHFLSHFKTTVRNKICKLVTALYFPFPFVVVIIFM